MSELDDLVDLIKSAEQKPVQQVQRPVRRVKKANRFVRSMGPGGTVFDFGRWTGNPIADRTTMLLQEMGDPVQAAQAQNSERLFRGAVDKFAVLGEQGYNNWRNQVPQNPVPEAREQVQSHGAPSGFHGVSSAPEVQKSQPAPQPQQSVPTPAQHQPIDFHRTEINVLGQTVKASSETDAGVVELVKAQGIDFQNDADIPMGGGRRVTVSTSGEVFES